MDQPAPAPQQSNPPAPAVLTSEPQPNSLTALGCLVGVVLLVLLVLGLRSCVSCSAKPGDLDTTAAINTVNRLLLDWQYDERTDKYWLDGVEKNRIYGVSHFRWKQYWFHGKLDGTPEPDWVKVSFLVKSSLRSGIPIEKLWYFVLRKQADGKWLVEGFTDISPNDRDLPS